jgi:hypothetical protein
MMGCLGTRGAVEAVDFLWETYTSGLVHSGSGFLALCPAVSLVPVLLSASTYQIDSQNQRYRGR